MSHRSSSTKLALLGALALGLLSLQSLPAYAVWHSVLSEHFNQMPQLFPWPNWTLNPNRNWYQSGPPYVWGVQDEVYKVNGLDVRSIWCCGLPPEFTPSEDDYPINMNAWAKWGPINLSQAVAASASFAYYCVSEADQDYFRWGAYGSNTFNMYEGGRRSGTGSALWITTTMDFDSLAGGTQSLLGNSTVYFELHFVSDGDNVRYVGAFVDELSISWDDGTFDFFAQIVGLAALDSIPVSIPLVGDSIRFSLDWSAEGSGTTPDFDITCHLDDALIYTERRNAEIGQAQIVGITTYSDPWVVEPDSHTVVWTVDAAREITEANEANNDTSLDFYSQMPNQFPSIIVTRPTFGDTSAGQFVIRWQDEDPDDNALIYLYWALDTLSAVGTLIPGALGIQEDDEADSFQWAFGGVPEGPIWILAMIQDELMTVYDFSEGPLIVDYSWNSVGEPSNGEIPKSFALQSIYPNPFNSSANLRLAVPKASEGEVRIYDLAGRLQEVAYRGLLQPGYHDIRWQPQNLPSGIYLVEFNADGAKLRSKVVYLK
jgi:hypothetical protein